MAYFLVIAKVPLEHSKEGGKAFTSGKLGKLPEFVKLKHVFVSADFKVTTYAIYEMDEDKYFEGIKALGTRYVGYNEVPGYEYKMVPLLEMKDALSMVGLG